MGSPAQEATDGRGPRIALRLMATTDVHMHILPHESASPAPPVAMGLARTASLIRAARAEVQNALLFDNGDFLHGTPLGDAIVATVEKGHRGTRGRHPIIAAMQALDVDAITLGNHDFDHGVEFLGHALDGAPFPVVVSNLSLRPRIGAARGPRPTPATEPFTILERDLIDDTGARHRVRIGVIGLLPPGSITGLRNSPFEPQVRDIVDTARTVVPQLRALGADLVVVLAHSGIGPAQHEPGMENALVPLAAVPGIDAIFGGHAHQVFPSQAQTWPEGVDAATGRVHGTPVVVPGFWGSHLGLIDLVLSPAPTGGWAVAGAEASLRPISAADPETGRLQPAVGPDPKLLKVLNRIHYRLGSGPDREIATTRRHLHSYFAAVAPSPTLDVVHRAQAWWARRAVAGSDLASLPIVASTSPFKSGGLAGPGYFTDIPPGPITAAALSELYPYPNHLCALRLTGAGLVEWLERAASVYNRVLPGHGDQPLLAPATPLYNVEIVAGCRYSIDLAAPARYAPDGTLARPDAHRIRFVRLDDTPLESDDELLLVTNSFRLDGGGGYPLPDTERHALDDGTGLREVLGEYLASTGPYDETPWANWRFAPIAGAAGLFLSSPDAVRAAPAGVVPVARRPDGFQTYRLAFADGVSYIAPREVGAGERLANPVRSGRKQP